MAKLAQLLLIALSTGALLHSPVTLAQDDGQSRLQRYQNERNRSIEQRDSRNTREHAHPQRPKANYTTPERITKHPERRGLRQPSEPQRVLPAQESRRILRRPQEGTAINRQRQVEHQQTLRRETQRHRDLTERLNQGGSGYRPPAQQIKRRPVVNQYYHRPGHEIHRLPTGIRRLYYRDFPLYYFGGTYYRPHSGGFIVVRAPIGVRLRTLPAGFITLTFGDTHYYHVNDVYYRRYGNEYVVVSTPYTHASHRTGNNLYTSGDWAIYPRYGQTDEQLRQDRYECHLWAFERTDYDPSQVRGDHRRRGDYYRYQAACLEGRGYSIK